MVFIPGHVRSRIIRGRVTKHVTCTFCGAEYVYRMKRKAGATTWSPSILPDESDVHAAKSARSRVNQALDKSTDPIPCPNCGMIQADMIRNAKRKRIFIMVPVFLIVTVLFYSFANHVEAFELRNIGSGLLLAVMVLLTLWTLLQNLNAHPECRKNDPRAITRPEFERMEAEEAKAREAAKQRIEGYTQ